MDGDNIISLVKIENKEPPINEALIVYIEELLEKAKRGEITLFSCASYERKGGEYKNGRFETNTFSLDGTLIEHLAQEAYILRLLDYKKNNTSEIFQERPVT